MRKIKKGHIPNQMALAKRFFRKDIRSLLPDLLLQTRQLHALLLAMQSQYLDEGMTIRLGDIARQLLKAEKTFKELSEPKWEEERKRVFSEGWISPTGLFVKCTKYGHGNLVRMFMEYEGDELFRKGWIRLDSTGKNPKSPYGVYWHTITQRQIDTLCEWGEVYIDGGANALAEDEMRGTKPGKTIGKWTDAVAGGARALMVWIDSVPEGTQLREDDPSARMSSAREDLRNKPMGG